jgi:hypothetical protein
MAESHPASSQAIVAGDFTKFSKLGIFRLSSLLVDDFGD